MEGRDRRQDLLKVADLFFEEVSFGYGQIFLPAGGTFGYGIDRAWQELLEYLGIDGEDRDAEDGAQMYSEEQEEYARSLFSELPAFLKKEWQKYRELRFEKALDTISERLND